MHEWVRRWEVTIGWERAADSPLHTRRHVVRVDSVAEMRELVAKARADRFVIVLRTKPVRELVGTAPEVCGQGHPIDGGSATRATLGWIICTCGGHVTYTCRASGCGDLVIDPIPDPDCGPAAQQPAATPKQ